MTATSPIFELGDVHQFGSRGKRFIYLVPAGAVFQLDEGTAAIVDRLSQGEASHEELVALLPEDANEILSELYQSRAIVTGERVPEPKQELPESFPLQTLVINLTNQCNLSCQYCYEFGEDKVATPEGKKKFMDKETAMDSIEYLLENSAGRQAVHVTFFGGETLMNFPVMKEVVRYANERAAAQGRKIDFSLTTNGTLLTPQIIEFLHENHIGVTVSMDGPKEMHDQLRVYANGKGSYDVIEPRVRALLANHHTRPIAARVTLTQGVTDVVRIFKHLKHDMGFHEVGFAPVTTSPNRLYSIGDDSMGQVLAQFFVLADEWLEYALRGRMHGFSNVSDTIAELYQGVNKSHPCGEGVGLLGVSQSGDVARCHLFVDSAQHSLGTLAGGLDKTKHKAFLDRGHVYGKEACQVCWARPLCAGGCHHEAYVRYGDTGHPNLHYCDWIRAWTEKCLEIFATIEVENPAFLEQFAERKAL